MPVVPREKVLRAYRNALATGDTDAARRLGDALVGRTIPRPVAAPRETGIFEDITSGFGAGVVGIGEMAALGAAAALEEESELAARERIQSIAESFRPEGGDPDSPTFKVFSGLGSIVGLASIPVAAGIAGAPGAAALGIGALAAGAAGAGEASERARAADATEEERSLAARRGLGIGLLDILPVAKVVKFADLPTLNKLIDKIPPEKVETIGERIYSAGVTGGVEGAQEAASNILQNLNEQEYNATAETFGGTAEEAAVGGAAGAILQGLVDLFAPRKAGKTIGDVAVERESLGEIDLEAEEAAQEAARERAGERQADMFALEKEQAERRLGPAMRLESEAALQAERDRLFPEESLTETPAAQRDLIDELETAEIEAAIDAEETANIETLVAADTEAADRAETEQERIRTASEREALTGRLDAAQVKKSEQRRREILLDVIENQPTRQYNTLQKRFSRALTAAGITNTQPTESETTTMKRAIDVARAEQDPLPAASDVSEMEAQIPEKRTTAETDARIATKTRGVDPTGVPSEQRRISEKVLVSEERRADAAGVPTGVADDSTSVGTDPTSVDFRERGEDTTETTALDGRAVGTVGRDADGVDDGKRRKRGALGRGIEKKKRGRPRTKPTTPEMSKIDPTTGDAEVVFPDGSAERVRREVSVDPDTGKKEFSFISLDRPDPDFPVDVGAPLLLGSTKETAIRRLTKVREAPPVEPVRRITPEELAERRVAEREASEIGKIRTAQRNVKRKRRVAKGEKARAEQRERIKTADLRKVRSAQREAADRLEEIAKEKEVRRARKEDDGVLYAPTRTEIELDSPMPEQVQKALRNNELRRALLGLAESSNDKFIKRAARKLADYTGDTRVQVVPQTRLGMRDGVNVEGLFVSKDNTILLSEDYQDAYMLLHEMTHAATINTLQNGAHPTTKRLKKLYEDTKDSLSSYYGSKNVAEFVAEAFSNPRFQHELGRINPEGKELSAWQRFIKTIMDFIGLGKLGPKTAQREADRMVQEILAPAAKHRYGPNLAATSDRRGIEETARTIKANTRNVRTQEGREKIARDFTALFDREGPAIQNAENVALGLLPNQSVQDVAEAKGFVGAKDVLEAIEFQRGDLTFSEANTRKRLDPIFRWANNASEKTMKAWNNLIYDSTIDEVDPALTPKQAKDKYENDTVEGTDQLKVDRHKELHAIYMSTTLGKDGRKAYDDLRQFYKDQYNELINALNGRIDNSDLADDQKSTLKNELLAKLLERSDVEPYFPLTRSGTYWLSVKNPEQLSDSAVFAFESAGDRIAAAEEYEAQGLEVDTFDPDSSSTYDNPPPGKFVSQVLNVLNVSGADPVVKEQVMRLFLESLPESSFAKALIRRKKTAGYDVDAVEAARIKAYDLARQTERIKNTNNIQRLKDQFLETHKGRGDDPVVREIATRADFATSPPKDSLAKNANRMAFLWTIGFNPSSAIVNLSQIPLFAYPMLSGKHGFKETGAAIKNATKLFMGSPTSRAAETLFGDARTPASIREALRSSEPGALLEAVRDKALPSLDNYYTLTRDKDGAFIATVRKDLDIPKDKKTELDSLKPLLELAARRGQLNSSFIADTLNVDQSGRKLTFMDRITNASALMFHEAEVMNRQVTLVSAYNLALNKLTGGKKPTLKQQQQAAEEAIYETQQINGGATLETGPRFAREGIGRVALMYKNYGIQMYYTMLKTGKQLANNMFPGDDVRSRELRNEAFKQLAGIHLSALFFAGVQGLPLYGAASMLYDLFTEEYEEDADIVVRRYLDNEMLYKGVLSEVSGLDVSQRVKLTDLLFEADRFNSDPSPEEEFAHLFGGPAWSVYSRGRKGIDKLAEGDVLRGIEDLLPGAVRNATQALIRYPLEGGIRTRRGDPIYDDITTGDMLTKLLGFPPTEYTRRAEETSAAKNLERSLAARRAKLLKKYYIAGRFGDREGQRDALREMNEFNKLPILRTDRSLRITPNTIDRSRARHETTSAEVHNGVLLSPNFKRLVEGAGFL